MRLATRKIHVSRDVVFHRDIFRFTLAAEKCTSPSILKFVKSVSFSPNPSGHTNHGSYDIT